MPFPLKNLLGKRLDSRFRGNDRLNHLAYVELTFNLKAIVGIPCAR